MIEALPSLTTTRTTPPTVSSEGTESSKANHGFNAFYRFCCYRNRRVATAPIPPTQPQCQLVCRQILIDSPSTQTQADFALFIFLHQLTACKPVSQLAKRLLFPKTTPRNQHTFDDFSFLPAPSSQPIILNTFRCAQWEVKYLPKALSLSSKKRKQQMLQQPN